MKDFSATAGRATAAGVIIARGTRCLLSYVFLAVFCALPAGGCAGRVAATISETRERNDTERSIEYVERLRDTVIYIALPQESVGHEVRCDSSFLQTSLAVSRAALLADGSLFHSLSNKPGPVAAGVSLPERRTVIEYTERSQQSRITEVPVKLPLTKPEKFLMISGIVLWAAATTLLARWIIGILKR